jgi:hypothetical protein
MPVGSKSAGAGPRCPAGLFSAGLRGTSSRGDRVPLHLGIYTFLVVIQVCYESL